MARTKQLTIGGWRLWAIAGRNKPLFMAERSACKTTYLFHVPFISIAIVHWDAL